MEFKINTRKRLRIFKDVLLKIKKEQNKQDEWCHAFLKTFTAECGLQFTSVIGKNSVLFGGKKKKETYLFKIVDKHKYLLAKIKYGI